MPKAIAISEEFAAKGVKLLNHFLALGDALGLVGKNKQSDNQCDMERPVPIPGRRRQARDYLPLALTRIHLQHTLSDPKEEAIRF